MHNYHYTKNVSAHTVPRIFVVSVGQTWIIGSSLVYWASHRAASCWGSCPELSVPTTSWYGVRGMRWSQLLPKIRTLLQDRQAPNVIILHLGGNDLMSTPLKKLTQSVKEDLSLIKQLLPHTYIIWSDIVARIHYRGARSNAKAEKARKSLNYAVHAHIAKLSGRWISHPLIKWHASELYRFDGVHLSDKGNDLLLQGWQKGQKRV